MDDLDRLLEAASTAEPMSRIEYRNRIAAFGVAAINRLEPWLSDPRLGAFAVRTIERAAAAPGAAMAAGLAFERSDPNGPVRDDIEAAWARLGGRPRGITSTRGGQAGPTHNSQTADPQLLRRFDADMLEVYEAAKVEAGYRATRFLRRFGGTAASRPPTTSFVSQAFQRALWGCGRRRNSIFRWSI